MKKHSLGPILAEGRTAEVYEIDQAQVVKLFLDWVPESRVQHEFSVAKKISELSLPTPYTFDLFEIEGRHGIIYERVDGLSMLQTFVSKPWLVVRYARLLADLQNEVHKFTGIQLSSQRTALIETIQNLADVPREIKSHTFNLLETLPDGDSLCHLDLHPDQVIITEKGPVIIDWLTAKLGHPLSDVARTCVLLKYGQVSYGGWILRTITNLFRSVCFRVYITHYLELNPETTQDEITMWMIPAAIGRLDENVPGERDALLRFVRTKLSL